MHRKDDRTERSDKKGARGRMDFFNFDYRFWLAIAGATLFKLLTSPVYSLHRALATVIAAVFCAWLFTDPVLDVLNLTAKTYREPVAALLALMGEGAMRWFIAMTPDKLVQFWKDLRR